MFPALDGPRVFALPPGVDFSRALIRGLENRLAGRPPEDWARVEIWVNTQRARRTLREHLASGPPRLLPRIRAVADLALDPLAPIKLMPTISALARKLDLAQMVSRLIAAEPGVAVETAAFDLADSLAELLDEMQGEGVDPAALGRLDAGEHAEHWQRSLRFLAILREYAAGGRLAGGQGRMRAVAEAWATAWASAPPTHPIIVAGSTGSRGATRAFMAAVAQLPQGALVLPGFDATLPGEVWNRLGAHDTGAADHPQFGFRRLAEAIGFEPTAIPLWHDTPAPNAARNALVSLALRPAPVTDQWRTEGAMLAPALSRACDKLAWVDAEDLRMEALTIALALRKAAEDGIRAALITPDRGLARRVAGELDRWSLIPDDSAGRPLALTPPGVLIRCLAALPGSEITPGTLLVLLKHPLTNSGSGSRNEHLALTARLETRRLRGGAPHIRWDTLRAWAEKEGAAASNWLAWLQSSLSPLIASGGTLEERVTQHRQAAELLAAGPSGGEAHELWKRGAGQKARALMDALAQEAGSYGAISAQAYRALLQSLMASEDVPEEAVVTHPGIAIWGTLEARMQSADLVILGGLNEGIWPRLPSADSWLNRAMRHELGLPSPERQVGLSAHDFVQAMGATRVILTRAARDANGPTVASRWLLRLENLMLGLDAAGSDALKSAREQGAALLAQAAVLDRPAARVSPARRPSPRPPLDARPTELSVTQIEKLIRDPYAIYARHVLGLRKLEPPGRAPDALARGTALHAALEAFLDAVSADPDADSHALFNTTARQVLAAAAPWPAVRALWMARLARAARWFIAGEVERRSRAEPFAREVRGERALQGLAAPFKVTARADRIDRTENGAYAIYDYKSGSVPSRKEAEAFSLQLPLEAAIAEVGGFNGLPAGPAIHLELIGIGARNVRPLDATPEAVARVWVHLCTLIGYYQSASNGFTARLRPQMLSYASDYDHLSRLDEWADGDAPVEEQVL